MTPGQVTALVAELIADKNAGLSPLAVKYEPYLADKIGNGQSVDDATLAQIKKDCAAFVDTAHVEAISRLREELANDPTKNGYKGKTADGIQALLMAERAVYADESAALTEEELINVAAAKIRGEQYEPVRGKTQRLVTTIPPRIGTIWSGIPYARNLPSLDNITEALQ